MNALVSTIKNHVLGEVTILLAERAHLHVLRMKYPTNATEKSLQDAYALASRYCDYFKGCSVVYWHSYISGDPRFELYQKAVQDLHQKDSVFRDCVLRDAENCYSQKWQEECPDKALFIEKTIKDILEHCVCWIILTKKEHRFHFYPGPPFLAMDYAKILLPSEERQLEWIQVSLLVRKKQRNEMTVG